MARVGIIRVRFGGQPPAATQILAICVLLNKLMKTDVWALVGIVVTTIQIQQVTHKFIVIFDFRIVSELMI